MRLILFSLWQIEESVIVNLMFPVNLISLEKCFTVSSVTKIALNPKSFLLSDYIVQDMPVLQVSSFLLLSSSAHIADSLPLMAALLAVKLVGIMFGFRSSSQELFLLHIFEGIQNEVQGMLFDIDPMWYLLLNCIFMLSFA